jgi:hypothetical protein
MPGVVAAIGDVGIEVEGGVVGGVIVDVAADG